MQNRMVCSTTKRCRIFAVTFVALFWISFGWFSVERNLGLIDAPPAVGIKYGGLLRSHEPFQIKKNVSLSDDLSANKAETDDRDRDEETEANLGTFSM
jgi:hypothetical protein